jgi:hypothetical protein
MRKILFFTSLLSLVLMLGVLAPRASAQSSSDGTYFGYGNPYYQPTTWNFGPTAPATNGNPAMLLNSNTGSYIPPGFPNYAPYNPSGYSNKPYYDAAGFSNGATTVVGSYLNYWYPPIGSYSYIPNYIPNRYEPQRYQVQPYQPNRYEVQRYQPQYYQPQYYWGGYIYGPKVVVPPR